MKLFLCSETITPEIKSNFEKLIGRESEGLSIAYIFTATMGYKPIIEARGDAWDLSWLDKEIEETEKFLKCRIDKYDINDMEQEEIDGLFEKYDGIWIGGGLAGYLMSSIQEKKFKNSLIKFAKEKFYIGTSAGSMICSKFQDASEWYIGEPEEGVSNYIGLELIPFQIYPHYDEADLTEILKARHKEKEYYLLKDGQAIASNGETIEVCGGGVTILK
jgi:peptidase E